MQGKDYFDQEELQAIANNLKKMIASDTAEMKTLTDPVRISLYETNIARLQRTLDIYINEYDCI